MPGPSRGLIVLNGKHYPILDVRLRNGGVELTYELRGPMKPFSSPVTVIDEDGNGCWQGSNFALTHKIDRHVTLQVTYVMYINRIDPGHDFKY